MIITKADLRNLDFAGKTVGITSGCFDLLHFYHLRYLERCKALCDFLIVGVDSDLLVSQNKNKMPVIPEHHRMAMVDALKCVDATFRMEEISDIDDYARRACADMMFKNQPTIYGNEVKAPENVKLVIIPDIEEVSSTTELINKIQSNAKTVKTSCEVADKTQSDAGNEGETCEETRETQSNVKIKRNRVKIFCYGNPVCVDIGSTIGGECMFGDRIWTVSDIEEEYDDETKENEVLIHCHNGRIIKTKNRELTSCFSGALRILAISDSNGIREFSAR